MPATGESGSLNPHSLPIHHFHQQDNPYQQAKPPPRRGAAAESPPPPTPQQGPDLLLGWRTQEGHTGVHHLYNCHLKVLSHVHCQRHLRLCQACVICASLGALPGLLAGFLARN